MAKKERIVVEDARHRARANDALKSLEDAKHSLEGVEGRVKDYAGQVEAIGKDLNGVTLALIEAANAELPEGEPRCEAFDLDDDDKPCLTRQHPKKPGRLQWLEIEGQDGELAKKLFLEFHKKTRELEREKASLTKEAQRKSVAEEVVARLAGEIATKLGESFLPGKATLHKGNKAKGSVVLILEDA